MAEVQQANSSVVQIKIGSRTYSAIKNPRCGVCIHPARFKIEERILLNFSNPAVSQWVSNQISHQPDGTEIVWPEISAAQVRGHKINGHVPVEAMTELVEQRAKEIGFDLEKETGQLVDHIVVQQAVMARGYEALVKGEITPDMKDLLTASKFIGDFEAKKKDTSNVEQWQEFMALYFNVVREVVEPMVWEAIIQKLQTHPLIQAMKQKALEGQKVEV